MTAGSPCSQQWRLFPLHTEDASDAKCAPLNAEALRPAPVSCLYRRRAGFLPLLRSEMPENLSRGLMLFNIFQYTYLWPVLAQLCLVVAIVKKDSLYEEALTEAVISFILFISHRMTVGAKYAGLSRRERRRLLHEEPVKQSVALNWRLQVASGWTTTPGREVLLAEMELASAESGVDLCDVWLDVVEARAVLRCCARVRTLLSYNF